MSEQLVRFIDVADPDGQELARLYLNVLPPVGTDVWINTDVWAGEDDLPDSSVETGLAKWTVDHHYWYITRRWSGVPNGKGGIAYGWRHLLSASVYLKRQM